MHFSKGCVFLCPVPSLTIHIIYWVSAGSKPGTDFLSVMLNSLHGNQNSEHVLLVYTISKTIHNQEVEETLPTNELHSAWSLK